MRFAFAFSLLILGLLMALCAAANAAPAHRRTREHTIVRPSQVAPVIRPGWYSFPGYPSIPPGENRNLDASTRGSA